ncbi:MAG: class I SAM-dependent methyltransferase [Hasllibacter sp.]
MRIEAVETSYRRWARIYDRTFGVATRRARARAVALLNEGEGSVLEVGCGTGLAFPHYREGLRVTAVDYSEDMLAKARARAEGLPAIERVERMDARAMTFGDAAFDQVAAMHVLSVVPEPARVVAEIVRVLKPGGRLVVSNHFRRERGPLALAERALTPFADQIGWHSDFREEEVTGAAGLTVETRETMPPFGMMTLLVMRRDEALRPG